jgi:hypothetical protein
MLKDDKGDSSFSFPIHDARFAEENRERWEDFDKCTAVYSNRGSGESGVNNVDRCCEDGISTLYR